MPIDGSPDQRLSVGGPRRMEQRRRIEHDAPSLGCPASGGSRQSARFAFPCRLPRSSPSSQRGPRDKRDEPTARGRPAARRDCTPAATTAARIVVRRTALAARRRARGGSRAAQTGGADTVRAAVPGPAARRAVLRAPVAACAVAGLIGNVSDPPIGPDQTGAPAARRTDPPVAAGLSDFGGQTVGARNRLTDRAGEKRVRV